MTRPDDIASDVWSAAESALDDMLCNCIEASGSAEQFRIDSIEPIARAIMAERERCAKECDRISAESRIEASNRAADHNYSAANHWTAHADGCDESAAAIRGGHQ